jgi:hypothetical protein
MQKAWWLTDSCSGSMEKEWWLNVRRFRGSVEEDDGSILGGITAQCRRRVG